MQPSNILVHNDGLGSTGLQTKFTDFGLAKILVGSRCKNMSGTGWCIVFTIAECVGRLFPASLFIPGTELFRAPEILLAKSQLVRDVSNDVLKKADVWSFGVTL